MRCPDETIKKMKGFTMRIANGYYKTGFVLEWGYYQFIEDLTKAAEELKEACYRQLFEAQKGIEDDTK